MINQAFQDLLLIHEIPRDAKVEKRFSTCVRHIRNPSGYTIPSR